MSKHICLLLLFAFISCSKPLVRQEEQSYAQSRKEAYAAQRIESAASFEALRADSVIVVRLDTAAREKTKIKYYGISKTKADTIHSVENIIELRIDTIYRAEKIYVKSEPGFFDQIKWILLGIGIGIIGAETLRLGRKLWT